MNVKPKILKKLSKYIDLDYNDLMYKIGYGIEVTPLNYFIKNHCYKLDLDSLESSQKMITFNLSVNKQAISSFKKIIDENNLMIMKKDY